MSMYEHVPYFSPRQFTLQLLANKVFKSTDLMFRSRWYPLNFSGSKVRSRDRDASKQRARNVPLALGDVRGGGGLRDEPKECLRRRLIFG